jgi:anti-sigma factor RsiW
MTCRDYNDAIAESLDGTLDPAKQRALERHVEGCEACRALVADLRSIQAAAFTLDRHEPPSHVLETLRSRIASETPPVGPNRLLAWPTSQITWVGWAAAAALVGATWVGLSQLAGNREPHSEAPAQVSSEAPSDPVASVVTELEAAAGHYDKAIQELEQIAKSDGGALDPQVAGVLQKNLQVIDQAIGESRAALKAQPASPDAQESLFDAMRSKVTLLQQTVELINEMRKGNQAEAGRLIQGLNQ